MSDFEETKGQFIQEHFSVLEIDLPSVEGECTISGAPGYGTPLTCDQPSNSTVTLKFTGVDSPLLPESGILRAITNITENTTQLKPGKGLSSRGTLSITFVDNPNKDPNPLSPAVLSGLYSCCGTYFGKLNVRNILKNRVVRLKNYRVESDGSIDLEAGAEVRHYIVKTMTYLKGGKWTLSCEDELFRVNLDEAVWPIPVEGRLRNSISDTATSIPVDPTVTYLVDDTIRIGDEFMKVVGVSDIGTGTATLTVQTRGTPISYTNILTRTSRTDHEAGDEIFLCEVSDNERIDDLLKRILIDIGIKPELIPDAEWAKEIDEWLPTTKVNTLWYESVDAENISEILSQYNIDMWFDPVERLVKISTVTAWKESSKLLTEGNEINYGTVNKKEREDLRATRALIIYDKRNLATSDDVENFKKGSLFRRTELEQEDLYGEPKTKQFGFSRFLDKDGADLLVNRYVNRFINPAEYSWITPERKLNFKVGDIVTMVTDADVSFSGERSTNTRSQITSINPTYKGGREYNVKALSYEPVFAEDSEIVIQGNLEDVNLFIQYAGAPSVAVNMTIVLDGVKCGSSAANIQAIKAGAFPSGSKVTLILANGADLMAAGGNGGKGESIYYEQEINRWVSLGNPVNGVDGGTVVDAQGVDFDIYLSGPTPSLAYPNADGYIRAPSGGDGGYFANKSAGIGGDGGNGGDGRVIGLGGDAGTAIDARDPSNDGIMGDDGTDSVINGVFGIKGADNNATGGLSGKGVINNGGTVNLFGATAARYINGIGDH